jgi:hypothetical protein
VPSEPGQFTVNGEVRWRIGLTRALDKLPD